MLFLKVIPILFSFYDCMKKTISSNIISEPINCVITYSWGKNQSVQFVEFAAAAAASVTCDVHYAKWLDIVLCRTEHFLGADSLSLVW